MMKRKAGLAALIAVLAATASGVCGQVQAADMEFELAPVVVTARREPEKLFEAKADISVVTRKQIETLHIDNIEKALRTVPGTQFLNYGSNGLNANLSGVRINGSKDIVILVDGVRVSDFQGADNSGYFYSSLLSNMDNVERVEVLRGSAATVYGSGAKGGVINIITRKINKNKATIDISRGSGARENYNLHAMGRAGRFGYSAYFDKVISGDTKDGSGNIRPGHTHTKSGGMKITYDFNDDHGISVDYSRLDSKFYGEDFVYNNAYHGDYESESFTLQDRWRIDEHWNNTLSFRRSKIVSNYYQGYHDGTTKPYSIGGDFTYHFWTEQIHFSDSANDLILGLDYSKVRSNKMLVAGFDEDGDRLFNHRWNENYSYFIQEEWRFLPRWTIMGGVRWDRPKADKYSPRFESHRSFSYKLSYEATGKDTLWAGRSDFYVLPGAGYLYNEEFGNLNLKPAEGRTTSVGYTHTFNDVSAFTWNWFETKNTRSIGFSGFKKDGGTGHYENFAYGIARGWNAQLLYQLGSDWNINLGWAHLYQNVPGDNLSMGYYPKDKLTFDILYHHDKFSAGLDGFYFIRRKDDRHAGLKGWPSDKYGIYNLSLNYSPRKEMTFYVRVDNIFNKLWAEHTDVIWNTHKPGTWYAMPGRVITAGIKLEI